MRLSSIGQKIVLNFLKIEIIFVVAVVTLVVLFVVFKLEGDE